MRMSPFIPGISTTTIGGYSLHIRMADDGESPRWDWIAELYPDIFPRSATVAQRPANAERLLRLVREQTCEVCGPVDHRALEPVICQDCGDSHVICIDCYEGDICPTCDMPGHRLRST